MRPLPSYLAALAALALAGGAGAQPSTGRLPGAKEQARTLRVEVGAGATVLPIADIFGSYRSTGPEPYAALASVRWAAESGSGLRLMGWWLGRDYTYSTGDQRIHFEQRILALAGTMDAGWRPSRRVSVALALGAGLASARGGGPDWTSSGEPRRATETGRLLTSGLALRYRSLVVEQHVLILLGAEQAVPEEREFFPLTVGWRF